MRVFRDFERRSVRITDERWDHVQQHPEMRGHMGDIARVLAMPERVVQSGSDSAARLYYRYLFGTVVGDKYLCVVVKTQKDDSFVLTAYFTDSVKRGQLLWPVRRR